MIGHVDNAEAIPLVAGETVTTKRGTSGPDWSNLQQDYERLGSFKAIAEEYGVARETVSRKAKELGVKSQRRWRKDNLDPAELRELYESGATVAELAERFHSSMSSIYLRLWMAGTEMRSPGPEGFTWGPEQYAKRAAAVARGAYEGTLSERYRRPGVSARRTVNSLKASRLKANAKPNLQRAKCEAEGIPFSPPRRGFVQPGCGADGGQPFRSATIRAPVAAGPHRSHLSFGHSTSGVGWQWWQKPYPHFTQSGPLW